ncbi:P-loop containing nucleoside triphosphate hydrolase protein [Helicostylum pulchrum]|nr:P-loop containing nucleoside triphosphate hydrolase protein [Helicostylum pulchrum]
MNNKNLHDSLRSLNCVQRDAVLSTAKSLQIVAGPGSGKTKVLVNRVSYLILEKKISPFDIIVVTFTKKAANELKERLKTVIGPQMTHLIQIGTFHSICCSILRLNAREIGMEPNFKILEERKRKEIIRELLADEDLPAKYADRQIKIGTIISEIDKARERGENHIRFQNIYSGAISPLKVSVSIFYQAYEEVLKRRNLIDFGGLILRTTELLSDNKVNSVQSVDCVLVDEFQDTSSAQYNLLKLIMSQSAHKSITVVGDPDQSIYGWRSAKNKVFQEMQDDFENTLTISLEQNYRSSAKLVESASHVIMQDAERMNKALYTNNPVGIPISLIKTADEKKQAEYVAYEISKVVDYSKGLIQYKDIAILIRANFITHQFERILRKHQIPFNLKGGDRFFNRMEIKDMLAYLRLAFDPYDVNSFKRIINIPKRNIRQDTIDMILSLSMTHQMSIPEAINLFLNSQKRSFFADRKEIVKFLHLCQSFQDKIENKTEISDILKSIYDDTNYYTHLRQHYYRDHLGRLRNISELVNMATSKSDIFNDQDDCNEEESAEDLNYTNVVPIDDPLLKPVKEEEIEIPLSQAPKETNQDVEKFLAYCDDCLNPKQQAEKKGGKVTLSTIHAAKGLEWPCVFVVSCIDGIIPASGGDNNEEKRILYVAMTRSKFLLYCISPRFVNEWGELKSVNMSPFLENMSRDLYSTISPVWNQELRKMLANTIKREIPIDDYFLRDSKIPKSTSSQPTPKTTSTNIPTATFTFYQPYSSSSSPKTKITVVPTYTYTSSARQTSSSSFPTGLKRSLPCDEDSGKDDWLKVVVKEEPIDDSFNL